MRTEATMVTTQPAQKRANRRPLNPRRPSHSPTPAIAPTVAGVDDMGRPRRDARMTTAATQSSTAKPRELVRRAVLTPMALIM
jgi:hypothetical protein